MRATLVVLGITSVSVWSAGISSAGELIFGCRSRPACGKMCKLVCDTTTLVSICYGCECDTICIPGPSRPGCKHCVTTCCGCDAACGDTGCCSECSNGYQNQTPECKFCWRDWFANGCAKPRTVKVLTKYEAAKEVRSYHWEVVDGCECCCPGNGCGGACKSNCRCVYKPAPETSQLGDVLKVANNERAKLVAWFPAAEQDLAASLAATATEASVEPPAAQPANPTPAEQDTRPPMWHRVANALRLSAD